MIDFSNPWLLILVILPWFARKLLKPAPESQQSALKVPFFNMVKGLSYQASTYSFSKSAGYIVNHLIWILLVIALAGPQWLGKPIPLPRSGRDIMLAVDLSGSMQIPDMKLNGKQASRLDVVKKIAGQFIDHREGDRLGLILFGTRAYLQTPLTFDRKTVKSMLNDASIGLAGEQTAIGDAIGLGVKRLMKRPKGSRVLILLTDGASNTGVLKPLQAAKIAKQEGIRIYTIGIGADKLTINGIFGPQVINPSADLDVKTLSSIANMTGGLFFRAKNTAALQRAYQQLDKLEPVSGNSGIFRPKKTLFYWPLAIALLLSFLLALRRVFPELNQSINKEKVRGF